MYKVFVNNKPIILSDKPLVHSDYEILLYESINFNEVLHKLKYSDNLGVYLYHPDIEYLWEDFQKYFKPIYAAGGIVKKLDSYLLINRNNHWDLPKGKMEFGENEEETAIREVEEECGIQALQIVKPLRTTYHVFHEKGKQRLKITSWFLMETVDQSEPIPQAEEGITQAKFIAKEALSEMSAFMYDNIRELIQDFITKPII